MGSLSSLLLAVAFFVGNSECHPTSREKGGELHEAMETCRKVTLDDCMGRLDVINNLENENEKLRDQVNRSKNFSVETGLCDNVSIIPAKGVNGSQPTYNISYNCQFISDRCQCTIEDTCISEITGSTDEVSPLSPPKQNGSTSDTPIENPTTSSTSPIVPRTSTDASDETRTSSGPPIQPSPSTSNFMEHVAPPVILDSFPTSASSTNPSTNISSTSPSTKNSSISPSTNNPSISPTNSANYHSMPTATSNNQTGNVNGSSSAEDSAGETQGHGIFVLVAGLLLLVVLVLAYIAYQKRQQIWDQISAKIWYVKKRSHKRKAGRYTALPQTLHDTVLHQD